LKRLSSCISCMYSPCNLFIKNYTDIFHVVYEGTFQNFSTYDQMLSLSISSGFAKAGSCSLKQLLVFFCRK
jgi:hypothetical protein